MSDFAHTVLRAGSHVVRLARRVTPILTPGEGWSGATAQPDAVGDSEGLGYSRKPNARWDSPRDTHDITGTLNIGVVAFHINAGGSRGIDYVEIAANGGAWVRARRGVNPDTGVLEYYVALRASDFTDGTHELRARVYPVCGVPRVLGGAYNANGEHSLYVTTNAGGTLPSAVRYVSTTGSNANNGLTAGAPKATVNDAIWSIHQAQGNVNGATIKLLAGTHTLANATWPASQMENSTRWLTIEPAEGVSRDDVHVRGAASDNRLGQVKLLRWHNVSIDAVTGAEVIGSYVSGARIWYDNCVIDGVDRTQASSGGWYGFTSWNGGKFITGCTIRNVRDAATLFTLVRNVQVSTVMSDAFSASACVLNSHVTDINPGESDAHPDIAQYHGGNYGNVLLYGVTSDKTYSYPNGVQGLFLSREASQTDLAVVDCVFSNNPSWSLALSMEGPLANVLISDTEIDGGAAWGQNLTTTDVVLERVTYRSTPLSSRSGVTIRS